MVAIPTAVVGTETDVTRGNRVDLTAEALVWTGLTAETLALTETVSTVAVSTSMCCDCQTWQSTCQFYRLLALLVVLDRLICFISLLWRQNDLRSWSGKSSSAYSVDAWCRIVVAVSREWLLTPAETQISWTQCHPLTASIEFFMAVEPVDYNAP